MKRHTKIYIQHFGYNDFIPSEISGQKAADIHHIIYKSRGGKDEISNLIALTRDEHDQAHFKKKPYLTVEELQNIHNQFLNETST